jgi:hypothetical protein
MYKQASICIFSKKILTFHVYKTICDHCRPPWPICVTVMLCCVQGATIKPIVNLLKVKRKEAHRQTMNEKIHSRVSAWYDFMKLEWREHI